MARRETILTVPLQGRDHGKAFKLTEMPATQGESWALRLFLALAAAGVDLPEGVMDSGMAGVAAIGVRGFSSLAWVDAKPLLDEMFGCVQVIPDPTKPQVIRALMEDDIEEIRTRLFIRGAVLDLHLGFSKIASLLTSGSGSQMGELSNTQTSPEQSPPSSQVVSLDFAN